MKRRLGRRRADEFIEDFSATTTSRDGSYRFGELALRASRPVICLDPTRASSAKVSTGSREDDEP